jgi:hypothetical protein
MSVLLLVAMVGTAVLSGQLLFGDLAPGVSEAATRDAFVTAGAVVAAVGLGAAIAHRA